MWSRILKHIIRCPLVSAATILFAVILTIVLCFLHRTKQEEQQSFENAYASVPVFFKITDLDGSRVSDANGIKGMIAELLTDSPLKPSLSPYVKELHTRVSYDDDALHMYTIYDEKRDMWREVGEQVTVTGISSLLVAEELTAGYGGSIHWFEGYDESILQSDEFVLVVPEELKDETEIKINFVYEFCIDWQYFRRETTRSFRVVGYYTTPSANCYYCPYPTIEWVYAKLARSKKIEQIGAILNDNDKLQELREVSSYWFAEPNPSGKLTLWEKYGYEYYFYALDINDNMLRSLETELNNSIRMNRHASTVVFLLSAGAGFLTGFLVIRSRKREIALMRTMGASHAAIYLELSAEQLLCIALGVLVGGSYALWQPIGKLCLFGGIYFVGLTVALLVFLRSNLLTTIKEDE